LRIESALGDAHIHPAVATDDPATIGPVDVVLVTVKLWDTEAAIRTATPLIGPETAVVSLQNGVDAAGRLAADLGAEHVMGGVSQIAAVIERPGVIRHTGTMATVIAGELDGRKSQRAAALVAALDAAGVDAKLSGDIVRRIWEKFVFLVGMSALTSVTRLPIGPVRDDPETRGLLAEIMSETWAVGRAKGVALDDDLVAKRIAFVDTLPAEMTASMAGDLARGNRLELDWLSGAVVRLGAELGVPTPANAFVTAALKPHAHGAPHS
jgi:2-dehydropantoate 2-reductase